MPQFSPGQSKNAIVPATVQPGGLSCQLEVFLGPNESTKVATSGLKAFTSTGAQQSVAAPVVMPSASGTYHVYIDLYAAGYYLAGYQATEDVVVAAPLLPFQFGAMVAICVSCPSTEAYKCAQLSCTISNPHDIPITQEVRVEWAQYNRTYGYWVCPQAVQDVSGGCSFRYESLCPVASCIVNPFSLTLQPGESYNFFYKGYCMGSSGWEVGAPPLWKNRNNYFWLKDETGNRSNDGVCST